MSKWKSWKSSTNWEDSWFGGYYKMLFDYPEIKKPFEIDTNIPDSDLTYYSSNKLIDMFLLKVNEHGLIQDFLLGAEIKKVQSWYWGSKEKQKLVIHPKALVHTLSLVIDKETELKNLFDHYSKIIIGTQFEFPVPDQDSKSKSGEGEEGGSEGSPEASEGQSQDSDEQEKGEGSGGEGEDEEKDQGNEGSGKGKDGEQKEKEQESKSGGQGKGDQKDKEQQQKKDSKSNGGKGADSDAKGEQIKEGIHKLAAHMAATLISDVHKVKSRWTYETGYVTGDFKKLTKWKMMPKRNRKCNFSRLEELYAKHLLASMDISFDPDSDRVSGLKMGKLDAKKLAECQAGNFHIYYTEQENQTTRPFSVCLLMDESGSMHDGYSPDHETCYKGKQAHQIQIAKILWKTFSSILPPDKIFVYGHSSSSEGYSREYPHLRIYNDKYNHCFEETIDGQVNNIWSGNFDGPAIESVYEKVREFTNDNIIFICISDGLPCASGYGGMTAVDEMKKVIEKCKRDGFVTIGIGVYLGAIKEIYQYHTIIEDLDLMAKQVSTLVNTVVKTEFQS